MLSVLIVDDDVDRQVALAELVRAEGCGVEVTTSLAHARDLLATRVPDVVLVAPRLSDGDGLELLGALGDPGAPDVTVVVVAVSGDAVIEALRRGASDYLPEPIDGLRLRGILVTVARRRAAILQVKVGSSMADVERRLILATIEACEGDKKHAAKILGISLKTLYNRLSRYKGTPGPGG